MSLRQGLIDLLQDSGSLDDDVLNYLLGIITEHNDDDGSEDICDALAGFSSHFATQPTDEQQAGVVALLQLRPAPAAPPAPLSASTSRRPSEAESRGAAADTSGLGTPTAHPRDALSPQEEEAVALLASLCPCPLPEGFLVGLFRDRDGADALQAAANRILETAPEALRGEAAAWEAAAAAAGKGNLQDKKAGLDVSPLREVDEELRRSIVSRFHLEAVPKGGGGGWGGGWGALPPGGRRGGGEGKAPQTRYREGVVVSTRGDKFVVENPPEWDGGSRGKVKSKRKGGVGWQ